MFCTECSDSLLFIECICMLSCFIDGFNFLGPLFGESLLRDAKLVMC
jgi:hypothetical protein